ncbi:MAG: c-type cytochrome [Gemmatimonadota bacterium]
MSRRVTQLTVVLGLVLAVGSCAQQGAAPAAPPIPSTGAPRSGTGVAAAPTPPATPAPGQIPIAGGPPGAGSPPRRVPLTPEQRAARRDSIAGVRAQTVKTLMEKLAGKEKLKAGDVFANLKEASLQDTTVEALLTLMDVNYSKALGVNCTFCHVAGQWDEDKKEEKETTRLMIQMVTRLNKEDLTKMPPNRAGKTPTIDCVTCHRGLNHPNAAILP